MNNNNAADTAVAARPRTFYTAKILIGLGMGAAFSAGFYGLDHFNRFRFANGNFFYPVPHLLEMPLVPGWVWVYLCYFPVCFLPLCLAKVRNNPQIFKRVALGFCIQFLTAFAIFGLFPTRVAPEPYAVQSFSERVLAWLHQVDHGFNAFPSLHVANVVFVAAVVWRMKGPVLGLLFTALTLAVSLSTVLVGQHRFPDVWAGMALGLLSFKLVFSGVTEHLLSENAASCLLGQFKHLWNLWIKSSPRFWDEQHRSGYWKHLKAANREPRYAVIRDLVSRSFPEGADILDVGCGEGILYGHIKKTGFYEGVDCSESAIAFCRANLAGGGRTAFHASGFETFAPDRKYDVIVFSEICSYLPPEEAARFLDKARTLLKDKQGMIIVSLEGGLKSLRLFRHLDRGQKPLQSVRTDNACTGGHWITQTYAARPAA